VESQVKKELPTFAEILRDKVTPEDLEELEIPSWWEVIKGAEWYELPVMPFAYLLGLFLGVYHRWRAK
jgi:hypothetical protein